MANFAANYPQDDDLFYKLTELILIALGGFLAFKVN
jgi:hypothetical protein